MRNALLLALALLAPSFAWADYFVYQVDGGDNVGYVSGTTRAAACSRLGKLATDNSLFTAGHVVSDFVVDSGHPDGQCLAYFDAAKTSLWGEATGSSSGTWTTVIPPWSSGFTDAATCVDAASCPESGTGSSGGTTVNVTATLQLPDPSADDIQRALVLFGALLACLTLVWGVKQIIALFGRAPDA